MKKVITILLICFLFLPAAQAEKPPEIVAWVRFSPLDDLGRVGPAVAVLGPEYPVGARSSLRQIAPTGWRSVFYEAVPGGWLFHRCHLIAHRFVDGDVNENIFTGTQALNQDQMAAVERLIAEYIARTGNHVFYYVSPRFQGEELICRSVYIRARSIEDCEIDLDRELTNQQPGVWIDYETGESGPIEADQDAA